MTVVQLICLDETAVDLDHLDTWAWQINMYLFKHGVGCQHKIM